MNSSAAQTLAPRGLRGRARSGTARTLAQCGVWPRAGFGAERCSARSGAARGLVQRGTLAGYCPAQHEVWDSTRSGAARIPTRHGVRRNAEPGALRGPVHRGVRRTAESGRTFCSAKTATNDIARRRGLRSVRRSATRRQLYTYLLVTSTLTSPNL